MSDSSDVMLAHIQGRINNLHTEWPNSSERNHRLSELELMLIVLRNANNLAMLANQANTTVADLPNLPTGLSEERF